MSRGEPLLFAFSSTRMLGEHVALAAQMPLGALEERSFEDGEHKARPLENVRHRDVFVVQSLSGDGQLTVNDKLCRLLFFLGALRDASAAQVTAVVPYLCYARKDRKTKSRDPVTTRYVAQLFEAVGTDRIVTVEVHNPAAFQNAFRIRSEHLDTTALFARHFADFARDNELAVVSPDAGGMKRARAVRDALATLTGRAIPMALMEKQRSEGVVSGELFAGDVNGRWCLIIDDLISSGTTLARTASACRERGAAGVVAAAAHGVFSQQAERVLSAPDLDQIVITNTVPPSRLSETFVRQRLTVLDIAPFLGEALRRIHEGGSLVELLDAAAGGRTA